MASNNEVCMRLCRYFIRHPARVLFILLLILLILLSRIMYPSITAKKESQNDSYGPIAPDRAKVSLIHERGKVQSDQETNKSQDKLEIRTYKEDLLEYQRRRSEEIDDAIEKLKQKLKAKMKFENHEKNILMPFVKAGMSSPLARSFRRCIHSICKHTSVSLTFNIVVDKVGKLTTEDTFKVANATCRRSFTVRYYDADEVADKVKAVTKLLQELFSSGVHSYFNNPVFFISVAMHYVLPDTISRVIMLDSDLEFRSDIGDLFKIFDQFGKMNIFGLAREQQPVYRHIFHMYRQAHSTAKLGDPPPDGITGYNSGVLLMDLDKMRNSHVYDQILTGNILKNITKEYQFQGHLGDQDFYTVISIKYPELFYTLPCSWNRQLCTWWRDNGYSDVFELYHKCEEPIHVYHGNCKSTIPE